MAVATSVSRHPRLLITTVLPRGVPGSTDTTKEAEAARIVVLPVSMLFSNSKHNRMVSRGYVRILRHCITH